MTAAPETISFPSHGLVRARPRLSRRWESALIVLGICLPVPLLAATGLSLPLPPSVERIAASLVPWAETSTLDENQALPAGTHGSIVLAPGEESLAAGQAVAPSAADNPRPAKDKTSTKTGGATGSGSGQGDGGGKDTETGGTKTPSSGGDDSGGTSSPVDDTVKQVTDTTQPVVDQVEGTVTGVVDTTDKTVDGLVSGLGG